MFIFWGDIPMNGILIVGNEHYTGLRECIAYLHIYTTSVIGFATRDTFLAVFCFAAISLILNTFFRLAVKNNHIPRIRNTIPSIVSIVPVLWV